MRWSDILRKEMEANGTTKEDGTDRRHVLEKEDSCCCHRVIYSLYVTLWLLLTPDIRDRHLESDNVVGASA